jgi:exopolyphosphatase/guanosine-5'-triphosphate,3'-diphosphate pyrophosphatase
MLLAAIDIGSNAVRLFFSNVFELNGEIIVEKASLVRIPLRLGEEVFKKGKISGAKADALVKTMKAFQLLIEVVQPVAYRACATAAMREAQNRDVLVKRIRKEAGIDIEVIDGLEEARIVSTVTHLDFEGKFKRALYIDVGGGSTEVSLMEQNRILDSNSFKIGTVRMLNGMVKPGEWKKMEEWLSKFKEQEEPLLLVGSGGNINKINKLYGDINRKVLSLDSLEEALDYLGKYSVEDRIALIGLRPDRADVIIPAGQIFQFIMKSLGASFVFVPKIGLSDGIVSLLFSEQKGLKTQKAST